MFCALNAAGSAVTGKQNNLLLQGKGVWQLLLWKPSKSARQQLHLVMLSANIDYPGFLVSVFSGDNVLEGCRKVADCSSSYTQGLL